MKDVKITTKLIIYFVTIGLVITVVVGLFSYYQAKDAILKRTEEQLISIRDIKKSQLEVFMSERHGDIEVLSQSEDVRTLIARINDYERNVQVSLFEDYPTETKEYREMWAEYGQFLIAYKETYGYHDLLVIDGDHGHVLFTIAKEADLGTNLKHGKYRETSLARLWKEIIETKKIQIYDFEPYAPSQGAYAMFIGAPVFEAGEVIGVVVLQISDIPINKIVNQRSGMGKTGELYLVGKWEENQASLRNNRVVKKGKIGDVKSDDIINKCLLGNTGFETKTGSTGAKEYVCYAPLKLKDLNWYVHSNISEDEVMIPIKHLGRIILLIGIGVIIILIILAYFLAKSFSIPILKGVEFAKKITAGDLTATVDINQKDEVGILADTLKSMVDKLKEVLLTVRKSSVNIAAAGKELNSSSQQMSSSAQQVSQGASEQAASAEEVSASMEEMSANIQQNTDNALQTEKIALKAADDILESSKHVNSTAEAMRNIEDKISLITEIAEKTNLLAINAAIEAARAGEFGKSFAVVASEVRALAKNSNFASKEIGQITKSSVKIAEKSGTLLTAIVPNIQNTSKLVQEIAAASSEQNTGTSQINNAVQQLNSVTQQNASSAEEMASGSEEVTANSEELSRQADLLKEAISFFNTGDQSELETGIIENKTTMQTQLSVRNKEEDSKLEESANGVKIDMTTKDTKDNEFEKY